MIFMLSGCWEEGEGAEIGRTMEGEGAVTTVEEGRGMMKHKMHMTTATVHKIPPKCFTKKFLVFTILHVVNMNKPIKIRLKQDKTLNEILRFFIFLYFFMSNVYNPLLYSLR